MLKPTLARPLLRPGAAHAVFLTIALLAAAALAWHGPIAQWPDYHQFADTRGWLGLPNAANVLSNLPFAIVGAWGLWRLSRMPLEDADRGVHRAWWVFSAAVAATAFGSTLYHWAPANGPLVFDRLPIAWACAALICALLAERVDSRWGSAAALGAALLAATLSVALWWITEREGHGDLRAYLWLQFLPMLLVPAVLALQLPPTGARVTPGSAWFVVLGLYAAAKLMELGDATVFDALGFASGHTLKHLLAAGAAWWLLQAASISCGSRR